MKTTILSWLQMYQEKIVLSIAFLLIAGISFGIGRFTQKTYSSPELKIDQEFSAPATSNYSSNSPAVQSTSTTSTASGALDCTGKIKGTSSMIYHVPGDSFYNRVTKPTACFDTEAQAQAAGFRKSGK